MNKNSKKIIIYYAVSENHIKNLHILKNYLSDFNFYCIYDEDSKIAKNNNSYNFQALTILELDEFLNNNYKDIECFIMSTAQVRIFPLKLLYYSNIYNIKTIAFQETHQLYLHNNQLNNYILPLDHLFVNSLYEKQNLIKNDNNFSKISIIKWPFFQLNLTKKNYKIIANKNILLILNATNAYNPNSAENINFQIKLINNIYNNLPKDYFLFIKPHPVENNLKIINYFKKHQNLFFKYESIIELIMNSNLVLSTGYTQSIIETLLCKTKLFIVNNFNNSNILNDYKYFLNDFKEIIKIIDLNFSSIEIKNIYEILNINYTKYEKDDFLKDFNQLFNFDRNINNKFNTLFQLYLWSIFLNEYSFANEIMKIMLSSPDLINTNLKHLKSLNDFSISLDDFIQLIHNTNDIKILIPLIEIFKIFIMKKKIPPNNQILKILNNHNFPDYFNNLLFLNIQNLINYFLYFKEKKLAYSLINKYNNSCFNIIKSKSLKFKIYLKIRDFRLFSSFNIFNKINFWLFDRFINVKK